MLSWIVLILILALLSIVGIWGWGVIFGRGEVMDPAESPRVVMQANRQAIAHDDLSAIQFDVVSSGYRQDQVDDALAVLQARIDELKAKPNVLPSAVEAPSTEEPVAAVDSAVKPALSDGEEELAIPDEKEL